VIQILHKEGLVDLFVWCFSLAGSILHRVNSQDSGHRIAGSYISTDLVFLTERVSMKLSRFRALGLAQRRLFHS
jgi:hypothetical protein